MHNFRDEVVWITGSSSGIGAALARDFAERGAIVCLSARRADKLEALANELGARGLRASVYPCDVTSEEDLEKTVAAIIGDHGQLDCAIANAGFGVSGRIESLTGEEWRRQLDVNVVGSALTAKYALPELRKSRGRLALVGSVMAMLSTPKSGAYAASKFAVRAIGQTLSMELHGSGVSCTTIHPGFVESDIARVDNSGTYLESRKDKRPAKLMWPTDKAAKVMVGAIARRKREFVFTGHGKVAGYLGRHFPGFVHFAQTRKS
ncbi:MAG: SDR family NAD(P)-dependent oxidoreductase [Kofleriaceae bacterium]|nr:SDR family NAD(P)-dependent oxidoreductase [Kofleriaceae bacterium]